jgi:rare lipoprotein A
VLLGVTLAACTHAPAGRAAVEPPPAATHKPALHFLGEGLASYYGPGLWGHKTANGERLSKGDFTAAHRTLPFGTCVLVVNVSNGRRVEVRVNDRGPYAGERLIDVTEPAARALDMLETGVTRVRLYGCPVDGGEGER